MYPSPEKMSQRLAQLAELEKQLTFRLSRLSKLLDIHAARQLDGSRLNLTWYRILMVLGIFEETTAADLGRLMVMDRAQLSRAAADMLAAGLLQSRGDPASRRRKLLSLTEAGRAELARFKPVYDRRQRRLEAELQPEELAGLTAAVDKISAFLAQELELYDATPTGARQPRPA